MFQELALMNSIVLINTCLCRRMASIELNCKRLLTLNLIPFQKRIETLRSHSYWVDLRSPKFNMQIIEFGRFHV